MVNSPAEQNVLLVEQSRESSPHRELPEPQAPFSQEFSQSARLRPLHQGLVGRQSIISTTLSLILPVLFGLAFGLGHNFFYWHLDGRPVDSGRIFSVPDQQWVAQIGIAFAFITKTCFAAAISTAFVQQVWMTVSRKPVPLSGIDSLWSILRNPILFTSIDMLSHAKVGTILALAAWLAPLASIPSTGSLQIVTQTSVGQLSCMVPSVDLSNFSSMPPEFYSQWNLFGGFTGSSPAIESLAARVLTGGSYVSWPSPCGYNCTYNITYTAPKYQCSDAQANGTDHVQKWQATDTPGSAHDTLTLVWAPDDSGSMLSSSCIPYNATYRLKIHYLDGVHGVDVLEETTHDPIATPPDNAFNFGNGPANLAGVKNAFVKSIKGNVNYGPSSGYYTDGTLAGYSKMANLSGVVPFFEDVPVLVEDYMRNMSISLLATTPPPPFASASCLTSTNVAVYQYKPTALMAGYGASFLVSLLSAIVGVRAVLYLGGGAGNSFSLVVSTTRNRKLDALFITDSGGEKAIVSQKPSFKYDMIEDDEGNLYYAFRQELPSSSLNSSEVSSQAAVDESLALSNTPTGT